MKNFAGKLILAAFLFAGIIFQVTADPPGPPGPGGDPSQNGGTPVGAPVDGGVVELLLLGAGYSLYLISRNRPPKTQAGINQTDQGN